MQDLQLLRRSGDDIMISYPLGLQSIYGQLWMGMLWSLWSENNNKVKYSSGVMFRRHLNVCSADFNVASGLRLQLHLLSHLHHNQQLTRLHLHRRGSQHIYPETDFFVWAKWCEKEDKLLLNSASLLLGFWTKHGRMCSQILCAMI